jgi:TetR/AcrR family transcriptional regulator, acrAB operon repressor
MARKPSDEQFDTLQVLRDRAFELFGRYGYEGVSIGDIAKQARLSKGALYWHFPGKDALYLDCLQTLHRLFDTYIFDVMRTEPDAIKAILALFQGLSRLLEDPKVEKGIGGFWLIPAIAESSEIMAAQRAFESASMRTVGDALRRASEAGRINVGGDLDDLTRAIISVVEAVVLPMRRLTREENHRTLAVMARTLFRAYASADDLLDLTRKI